MQYSFDSGHLFVTPKGGSPVRIGSLQELTVNIERSLTLARAAFQVPVKAAHSMTRLKGHAKQAQINGALFSELFFGQAHSSGSIKGVDGTEKTIPGSPYQLTIVPPESGTFGLDLGVRFQADGTQLTLVSSSPQAGQYSVSGNVYTFAAGDTGKKILVSFTYTLSTGRKISVMNPYWMESPTFEIVAFTVYNCKQTFFRFPVCVSQHLNVSTVLENWTMPEFDFEVLSNAQGLVAEISTAE